MGTRADFYIGRGENAEWLGSIAWDGYPGGIPDKVLCAHDEATYRANVAKLFESRDDTTLPAQGWPWPWKDSRTTDYAYAFDNGIVYAASFGYKWFVADKEEPDEEEGEKKECVFPNMKSRQRVTFGKRSGIIIVSAVDSEDKG